MYSFGLRYHYYWADERKYIVDQYKEDDKMNGIVGTFTWAGGKGCFGQCDKKWS